MRLVLAAALLVALGLGSADGRSSRPRSPTALDETMWNVASVSGRLIEGRLAKLAFYSNGRVQLYTICSSFMAGDFGISIWGLRVSRLDPPTPRLPCSDAERREERLLNDAVAGVRRYRFANDGKRLILKLRDGSELIAER
jgi:hypothetical protein